MNVNQEKDIERVLQRELSGTLYIDRIHFPDDEFAFLISTSAGERIFEQSKDLVILIA